MRSAFITRSTLLRAIGTLLVGVSAIALLAHIAGVRMDHAELAMWVGIIGVGCLAGAILEDGRP